MDLLELALFGTNERDYLVKLSSKEIKGSQDGSVWSELISLHDILVLDRVTNVNVAWKRYLQYCGIQVYIIRLLSMLTQVRYQSL